MAPPDKAKRLEALKPLEVPGNREDLTRKFLRDRTLFGERAGSELIRRSSLDVVVDVSGSADDFSRRLVTLDANSFERFVSGFSDDFGVSRDNVGQNQELREAFLKLKEIELDAKKRCVARGRYFELKKKVGLGLAGYIGENTETAERFYNSYIKLEKDRYITGRIFALSKSNDARLVNMVEDWRAERIILDEDYGRGLISEEEYLTRRDRINEKAIKESDDRDLQETWSLFGQDEGHADQNVIPDNSDEKPVTNKDEVKAAFVEIGSHGLPLDFHDDGSVSVALGDEKFPVDIAVFRNEANNQLVYYIVDSYSDDGIVKVSVDSDLMNVLDQRYIDAYLTSKISAIPGYEDSPFELPDREIITLCERLIGKGDKRGYKMSDEDKLVLDALIPVLVMKDERYPGLYAKVQFLNELLGTEENVSFVRRKLLSGTVRSLQDLREELG